MADGNEKKRLREILTMVAKAAISTKAPFLGALVLGETDVVEGLVKLVDFDYLHRLDLQIDKLTGKTANTLKSDKKLLAAVLGKINDAVTRAQKSSAGALTLDGIFGLKTMNWIRFTPRCHGKLERPDPARDSELPAAAKNIPSFEYRYFIENVPKPAPGFDPDVLLEKAWISWQAVCGIVASETKNRDKANVIVSVENIDGPSNILADAHIGPPNGFVLELRIDEAEAWDAHRFEAAICHEIGHLIGLGHSSTPGQLMNANVGSVTKPMEEDKTRARSKWGNTQFQQAESAEVV